METILIPIAARTKPFHVRERRRDLVEKEHAAEDVVSAVEDDRVNATIRTNRKNGRMIGMTSTDKNFCQWTVLGEFLRENMTLSRKNKFFLNRNFIQIFIDDLVFLY